MLHPPEPSTDREYLSEIYNAVQRIQGQLVEMAVTLNTHDRRLTRLEAWRNWITGGIAVAGLLASVALGKLLAG